VKRASFLAVLALVAVGAMALAGAGSAAKASSAGVTAVPRAAGNHVGAGLVRQVGARNYAGPNCPGRGWNCTTATRVLQVATAGGTNAAVCSPSTEFVPPPTPQSCVIKQLGGSTNTARCTEQSSDSPVVQTCDITQSGAANYAFVNQNISQSDGFAQTGTQKATVDQSAASVTNQVQLSQAVSQSVKIGDHQTQDAYQSAVITQSAVGSGTNFASPSQSQLQKEYARSTIQKQNTNPNPPDCDPDNAPTAANACANVIQHSENGTNQNHLRQSIAEDANSSGPATQTQGSSSGGIDGHVHQDSGVGGSSTNEVNQSKGLKETVPKGPGSIQKQFDPISCCGFASQSGGSGNTETISQSSSVSASGPAIQSANIIGTSNTDGTCQVSQSASINNQSTTNSANFTPCPFLTATISCSSDGGCSHNEPAPGPDSAITLGVRNLSNNETAYGTSTNSVPGNTLQYLVTYTNSGAPAHNVSVGGYQVIPTGTTPIDAIVVGFDGEFPIYSSFVCPETLSPTTCILGPTPAGTVSSDTLEVFRTATFTVTVPNTCGAPINFTEPGHTDEEGSLTSNLTTVNVNTTCDGQIG
jgi:hypothetical protein